ncbi:MAG: hypothetical protein J5819_05785 [Eubacterium sp.]|nr:hypothetical protein [Eubacterium sp.]
MNWLRRVMMGRYGRLDQLNIALFIFYLFLTLIRLVLSVIYHITNPVTMFQLGIITLGTIFSVIYGLQIAAVVIFILRIFSRNIAKRQAENARFVNWLGGFRDYSNFRKQKKMARQDGKALYKCPSCKKVVRVPLGRGRIEITCPNCKHKFIKRT